MVTNDAVVASEAVCAVVANDAVSANDAVVASEADCAQLLVMLYNEPDVKAAPPPPPAELRAYDAVNACTA